MVIAIIIMLAGGLAIRTAGGAIPDDCTAGSTISASTPALMRKQ
ncbi:hypothetical protein ACNKHR_05080 [Shigella flexneri]